MSGETSAGSARVVQQQPHHFQVDLRGIVDLLAHHLYSTPRVYVRELLQNSIDAITARAEIEADFPSSVVFEPPTGGGRVLRVHDSGIGLLPDEIDMFLATVGRSSKRDELAGAREDMLGQFGIGLLSAFMVSDEIKVVTRSARRADAPTVEWVARSDGSYTTRILGGGDARRTPGTTVELTCAPDRLEWVDADRVAELATYFGALLPVDIQVDNGAERVRVTSPPPWRVDHESHAERRAALLQFGHDTLGFTPFDVIEIDEPLAGLHGCLYVLPHAAPPTARSTHRVWLKGMLLGEHVDGLLPAWAFFVRAAVDTSLLRPTASREALYEDAMLDTVREALGRRIRQWLLDLITSAPERARQFLTIHHLGVKSMALTDNEMLDLVAELVPFETTLGAVPLAEFRRTHPLVRYTETVDDFRRVAAVAAAQGLGVVNGGYTYDSELLARLGRRDGWTVEPLDASVMSAHLDPVPADDAARWHPVITAAQAALDAHGVEVQLRCYDPAATAVLYVDDRDAWYERSRQEAEADADELWSSILSEFGGTDARPRLVLNHRNPLIRRLPSLGAQRLLRLAVETLYVQALLLAHRPLRPSDSALLTRSLGELLDHTVGAGPRDA